MVTPISPHSVPAAPIQYNCTRNDFEAMAEVTVLPVYRLYQASGWQQAYQTFLSNQWNNYDSKPSSGCNNCCWLKRITTRWRGQLPKLTPGSSNYNLKQAKVSWGEKMGERCCTGR